MSIPIIQVNNLTKRFIISHEENEQYSSLRDVIARKTKGIFSGKRKPRQTKKEEFLALQDVNFCVNEGERLGIIGRNGAGKSTLLKILSRISEPTNGTIKIRGRVASLLEVGTGFHPELTGRENIFLNGAILGMNRLEIRTKFDEIVSFAEVEKFLDTPVKRYSSGMYVRLAFAVAAHLEPEILIVDEVLAVGDAQFQKKCLGKMEDVSKKGGKTVLFVSHNMASLKALCETGIFLQNGTIKYSGKINETIKDYLETNSSLLTNSSSNFKLFDNLTLTFFSFDKHIYTTGDDISYYLEVAAVNTSISNLSLLIFNEINERIAIIDLRNSEFIGKIINKSIVIEGTATNISLIEGSYRIGLFISNSSESANFFDLVKIEIVDSGMSEFIKYPIEVRGFLEIENVIKKINIL